MCIQVYNGRCAAKWSRYPESAERYSECNVVCRNLVVYYIICVPYYNVYFIRRRRMSDCEWSTQFHLSIPPHASILNVAILRVYDVALRNSLLARNRRFVNEKLDIQK